MDFNTVFSKTPKASRAPLPWVGGLSAQFKHVLSFVDGKQNVEGILRQVEKLNKNELQKILLKLEEDGYIKRISNQAAEPAWLNEVSSYSINANNNYSIAVEEIDAAELDFDGSDFSADTVAKINETVEEEHNPEVKVTVETDVERRAQEVKAIKAKREAERKAQAEAAQKARLEAVEQAKRIEEVAANARQEVERIEREKAAKVQADAEEQARVETERKAQEELAANAKLEAAEQARLEAERIAREEAEEQTRLEAERIEREKAEAIAKAKAEEEARLKAEAEEQARVEAERKAQAEAAEQARLEAERIAREEAEEKARLEAERIAREKAEAIAKAKAEEEARLKAEAEEQARVEAERKAQAEAAEQARLEQERIIREEAEAQARIVRERKAQEELAAKAKQEAEEKARLEAERIEREKAEAIAKAKAEEEARLQAEVERKAKAEADELAREEAERRAQLEAAEQKLREAERLAREQQKAQREAEEKAQAEAEKAAREEAKRLAKEEKAAKAILKAEERARAREMRGPTMLNKLSAMPLKKWLKPLLVAISLAVILLIGLIHVMNLTMLIEPIEKLASDSVGEPVKVREVHASLFPEPHLKLIGVTVGSAADVKIGTVNIMSDVSMLFKDVRVLESIEVSAVTLTPADFGRQAQWVNNAAKSDKLKIEHIILKQISFKVSDLELETFNGKVTLAPSGELGNVELVNVSGNLTLLLTPQSGHCAVTLTASDWQPPVFKKLALDEVTATGVISQNHASFSQIEAKAFGGIIKAQGALDWTGRLSTSGNFELVKMTLPRILSAFDSSASVDGTLNAIATFTSNADQASELVESAEVNANFEALNGKVNGINLSHALMAGPASKPSADADFTRFDTLAGNLQFKDGQYKYKQLVLKTEQFRARGNFNIEADNTVSGKVSAELVSASQRRQTSFAISGEVADVKLQ